MSSWIIPLGEDPVSVAAGQQGGIPHPDADLPAVVFDGDPLFLTRAPWPVRSRVSGVGTAPGLPNLWLQRVWPAPCAPDSGCSPAAVWGERSSPGSPDPLGCRDDLESSASAGRHDSSPGRPASCRGCLQSRRRPKAERVVDVSLGDFQTVPCPRRRVGVVGRDRRTQHPQPPEQLRNDDVQVGCPRERLLLYPPDGRQSVRVPREELGN